MNCWHCNTELKGMMKTGKEAEGGEAGMNNDARRTNAPLPQRETKEKTKKKKSK